MFKLISSCISDTKFCSIFSAKIIPISRIFDKYERLHPFHFVSVLYRTYNLSPLAQVCISNTTPVLIVNGTYSIASV